MQEDAALVQSPSSRSTKSNLFCCCFPKRKSRDIFVGQETQYLPPPMLIEDIRTKSFCFPDEKEVIEQHRKASMSYGSLPGEDVEVPGGPEDSVSAGSRTGSSWDVNGFGGPLQLKSSKKLLGKHTWTNAYFSLEPEEISYYVKKGGRPLGSIPYNEISRIESTKKNKGRFTVFLSSNQEFHLRAKSEQLVDGWLEQIHQFRHAFEISRGLPSPTTVEPDVVEGVLSKKSSKQVMGKRVWNKKHFRLDRTGWLFFPTSKGNQLSKTDLVQHKVLEFQLDASRPDRFSITVQEPQSSSTRILELQAPDKATATRWTDMLRRLPSSNSAFPTLLSFNKKGTPQFGLEPKYLESTKLLGYVSPIPNILILLRTHLVKGGGLDVKGIFRITPELQACALAVDQLNTGSFTKTADVHVIGSCIKLWFRQLPIKLLNPIDPDKLHGLVEPFQAGAMVSNLVEPFRSLTLWFLDLCVLVVRNKSINSMDAKNLSIVFGPNFSCRTQDPQMLLVHANKITSFVEQAIEWRIPLYHESHSSPQS